MLLAIQTPLSCLETNGFALSCFWIARFSACFFFAEYSISRFCFSLWALPLYDRKYSLRCTWSLRRVVSRQSLRGPDEEPNPKGTKPDFEFSFPWWSSINSWRSLLRSVSFVNSHSFARGRNPGVTQVVLNAKTPKFWNVNESINRIQFYMLLVMLTTKYRAHAKH